MACTYYTSAQQLQRWATVPEQSGPKVEGAVTGQLADTPTRGLDNSRSSPRVAQSASWQSASCPVTEGAAADMLYPFP